MAKAAYVASSGTDGPQAGEKAVRLPESSTIPPLHQSEVRYIVYLEKYTSLQGSQSVCIAVADSGSEKGKLKPPLLKII